MLTEKGLLDGRETERSDLSFKEKIFGNIQLIARAQK